MSVFEDTSALEAPVSEDDTPSSEMSVASDVGTAASSSPNPSAEEASHEGVKLETVCYNDSCLIQLENHPLYEMSVELRAEYRDFGHHNYGTGTAVFHTMCKTPEDLADCKKVVNSMLQYAAVKTEEMLKSPDLDNEMKFKNGLGKAVKQGGARFNQRMDSAFTSKAITQNDHGGVIVRPKVEAADDKPKVHSAICEVTIINDDGTEVEANVIDARRNQRYLCTFEPVWYFHRNTSKPCYMHWYLRRAIVRRPPQPMATFRACEAGKVTRSPDRAKLLAKLRQGLPDEAGPAPKFDASQIKQF